MFVQTVMVFLDKMKTERKKERRKKDNSLIQDLLGFTAGKNSHQTDMTE